MAFSNQNKINISNGLVSAVKSLMAGGQVRNNQAAFNAAIIGILEKLMVELEDKVTNEEYIAELEVVLAEEEIRVFDLAKQAAVLAADKHAQDEAAIANKVQQAKDKRATKRPGKVKP